MARKVYSREFKQSAVSLVTEQQYKPEEAAKNLGVNLFTLKSWLQAHRRNGGVVDAAEQADLRQQLAELQKQNARLRMERDILKKAATFFAKESS
jgi:transposase